MKKNSSKKNLISKLISLAIHYGFNHPINKGKPGELLNKLTFEERKTVESLTAEDFQCRDELAVGFEPLTFHEKVRIEKLKFDKKIL